MQFIETPLTGAYVIELDRHEDDRGFFARTFCVEEFKARGLNPDIAQTNISFNKIRGTVRGMHYQAPPSEETKLIRCTRGSIYDVIVDLRHESPTYLDHFGVELSRDCGKSIYVPPRFGHGFQTLEDHTEVHYQMGDFFAPEHARGFPYNDSALGVSWPLPVTVVSEKDQNNPPLDRDALAESVP